MDATQIATDALYATTRDQILADTSGLSGPDRKAELARREWAARAAFYNGDDPTSDMVRWVAAQAAQIIADGRTDHRYAAGVLRQCDYATAIQWVV